SSSPGTEKISGAGREAAALVREAEYVDAELDGQPCCGAEKRRCAAAKGRADCRMAAGGDGRGAGIAAGAAAGGCGGSAGGWRLANDVGESTARESAGDFLLPRSGRAGTAT